MIGYVDSAKPGSGTQSNLERKIPTNKNPFRFCKMLEAYPGHRSKGRNN